MISDPIRDKGQIDRMYHYLKNSDRKYALLFKVGLNTGLRLQNILRLRFNDICDENGTCLEYLTVKIRKSIGEKRTKLPLLLQKEINEYVQLEKPPLHSFVFLGRKGQHVTRVQAYRVLKEAAERAEIKNFSTDSMRKTWGYWTYLNSRNNMGLIMEVFGRSSPSAALQYIGIDQNYLNEESNPAEF